MQIARWHFFGVEAQDDDNGNGTLGSNNRYDTPWTQIHETWLRGMRTSLKNGNKAPLSVNHWLVEGLCCVWMDVKLSARFSGWFCDYHKCSTTCGSFDQSCPVNHRPWFTQKTSSTSLTPWCLSGNVHHNTPKAGYGSCFVHWYNQEGRCTNAVEHCGRATVTLVLCLRRNQSIPRDIIKYIARLAYAQRFEYGWSRPCVVAKLDRDEQVLIKAALALQSRFDEAHRLKVAKQHRTEERKTFLKNIVPRARIQKLTARPLPRKKRGHCFTK